ncbi:hypothetical protein AMTR_s00072p00053040 [Amborella trichopoda]|uniref:Uncharacterized protein n=1 Tax=Amborella trichopoda TaxID=13333 RepID=W1NUP9_AMBTC|nr:hypothetical protein AMTR_s00072p00053040 [Amborella trichopoda]
MGRMVGKLERGFGRFVVKLGQVSHFRCSEAVLEGLEAEKRELQREHRSFTALDAPVFWF